MNKDKLEQVRFNLATNLISYLINIIIHEADHKKEIVDRILNRWNQRIEHDIEIITMNQAKKLVKQLNLSNFTEDVANIYLSIFNVYPELIRTDFKEEIRKKEYQKIDKLKC